MGPFASSRIDRVAGHDPSAGKAILELLQVASTGLRAMFDNKTKQFVFSRRGRDNPTSEGHSIRYSGIVLLGAQYLDEALQRSILGGLSADQYCGQLIDGVNDGHDLGDVAAVCWAAASLKNEHLTAILPRLRERLHRRHDLRTVANAWALSALVAAKDMAAVVDDAVELRDRLLGAVDPDAGLWPHYLDPKSAPWLRAHIGCFADQVYPIQALSRFHAAFGDNASLAAADCCAERICRLQGAAGQWWWHYDVRRGTVVEGYPVYSVHQDAMGPMCLFELSDAGGRDFREAIHRSLDWVFHAPEVGFSLVDAQLRVIWRKVARTEPCKLSRGIRAVSSRIHPALRFRMLDRILRPRSVDYECRPYHLGWILYTWLGGC